jgi:hypothetical protein
MRSGPKQARRDLVVWLSCLLLMLPPGLAGILIAGKLFAFFTGIPADRPIGSHLYLLSLALLLLLSLAAGALLGGLIWTVAMSYYLTAEEMRRWANYPAPKVKASTRPPPRCLSCTSIARGGG